MLTTQSILGLPLVLVPGTFPCMISFSKQSPFFLIRWAKYVSFLLLIEFRRLLSTTVVSNTHSFVFLSRQDTLKICLRPFISNTSILSSSLFLIVQFSHPYVATGQTSVLMSLILVGSLML